MLVVISCAATVPGGAGPPGRGPHVLAVTAPSRVKRPMPPGAWAWVGGRGGALFLTGWVVPGL